MLRAVEQAPAAQVLAAPAQPASPEAVLLRPRPCPLLHLPPLLLSPEVEEVEPGAAAAAVVPAEVQ